MNGISVIYKFKVIYKYNHNDKTYSYSHWNFQSYRNYELLFNLNSHFNLRKNL